MGIKYKERRLIYNFQMAIMNVGNREKLIYRKEYDKDVFFYPRFLIYQEEAIKELKDNLDTGIQIQVRKISLPRFGDSIGL